MQTINRFLYGPTPEEKVRAWQGKLRSEQRALDRQMRQLDAAIKKGEQDVKRLAKKGDVKSARIMAVEIVRCNKQVHRLSVSKAMLGSVSNQLQQQLGVAKVTGSLKKSTEIMKHASSLVKMTEISQTMRDMSMEWIKAGVMEEMLDDALATQDDEEELEEEADAEVDKVLHELTEGKLGQAGEVPTSEDKVDDEETARKVEQYRQALDGLLSA